MCFKIISSAVKNPFLPFNETRSFSIITLKLGKYSENSDKGFCTHRYLYYLHYEPRGMEGHKEDKLLNEIIAVYSENRTKTINTLPTQKRRVTDY
jgi:hypothetical protein